MSSVKKPEHVSTTGTVFILCVGMAIGYIFGIGLAVFLFDSLSAFFGAIGQLLGTALALTIMFILIFSIGWAPIVRIFFYGLAIGIIVSLILNHELFTAMVADLPVDNLGFWFLVIVIIGIILFLILYIRTRLYVTLRRKDIVYGLKRK